MLAHWRSRTDTILPVFLNYFYFTANSLSSISYSRSIIRCVVFYVAFIIIIIKPPSSYWRFCCSREQVCKRVLWITAPWRSPEIITLHKYNNLYHCFCSLHSMKSRLVFYTSTTVNNLYHFFCSLLSMKSRLVFYTSTTVLCSLHSMKSRLVFDTSTTVNNLYHFFCSLLSMKSRLVFYSSTTVNNLYHFFLFVAFLEIAISILHKYNSQQFVSLFLFVAFHEIVIIALHKNYNLKNVFCLLHSTRSRTTVFWLRVQSGKKQSFSTTRSNKPQFSADPLRDPERCRHWLRSEAGCGGDGIPLRHSTTTVLRRGDWYW